MSINFENILILVSSYMDLFGLPFCAQVAWTYMITILCSGHIDLYDWQFVLRLHRPVWSTFCTQATWTYFACVNSQHRGTLDSELFLPFCTQATQTYMITILCLGHTDLYDCHFVLRLHRPIQLAFCTQVAQTYNLHLNIGHLQI